MDDLSWLRDSDEFSGIRDVADPFASIRDTPLPQASAGKPLELKKTPAPGYEEPSDTWYGNIGRGVAESLHAIEGAGYGFLGRGLKTLGAEETGQQFVDEAKRLESVGLGAEQADLRKTTEAWKAGDYPTAVAEGLKFGGTSAAMSSPWMVLAGLNTPAFAVTFLENLTRERARNQGREEPTWQDFAETLPAGGASILLEKFGIKGLLNAGKATGASSAVMEGIKAWGKATAREAGTEAIQEPLEYAAETVGTLRPFDPTEAGMRSLGGALGGLIGGGAISAVTTPMNLPALRGTGLETGGEVGPPDQFADLRQPELVPVPEPVPTGTVPPVQPTTGTVPQDPAVDLREQTIETIKQEARNELDRLGLKDIETTIVDRLFTPTGEAVDADYGGKILRIALDTAPEERVNVINHEVVHALKELGLFKTKEWWVLERSAELSMKKNAQRMQQYITAYGLGPLADLKGMDPAARSQLLEEAIADMNRDYKAGLLKPASGLRGLLDRLNNFLEATGNSLRGMGFQSSKDVLERIQRGEVGRRAAGEMVAPGGRAFSLRQHTPTQMYSALERMVEGVKQERMPGKQWLQYIQANAPKFGVKEPEIQWTLVRQFLADRINQPVTKFDLLRHLETNAIKTSVVGGSYESGLISPVDAYGGSLEMVADPIRGWTMPGLTDRGAILVGDVSRPYFQNVKSHYFNQRGTVGWVRYGIAETSQGEPAVFVDEVQSDWGQARKEGQLVDLDYSAWRVVELPVDSILDQIVEKRIEERIVTDETLDVFGGTSTDIPTRSTTPEERDEMRVAYREQLVQEIREDLGLFSSDRRIHYYMIQGATGEVLSDAHPFVKSMIDIEGNPIVNSGLFARDPDHAKARMYEAQQRLMRSISLEKKTFPAGPYVSDTALWVQRLIKEITSLAIDNGIGLVVWTNGNDQMQRSSVLPQNRLEGLGKFYDETLPQLIAAAMKPYGVKLEAVNLKNLRNGDNSRMRRPYAAAFWDSRDEGSNYKRAIEFLERAAFHATDSRVRLGNPRIPTGTVTNEQAKDFLSVSFTRAAFADLRDSLTDLHAVISDTGFDSTIQPGASFVDEARGKNRQTYNIAFGVEALQTVEMRDVYDALGLGSRDVDTHNAAVSFIRKEEIRATKLLYEEFERITTELEDTLVDHKLAKPLGDTEDERTGFRITQRLANEVLKNGWRKFSIRKNSQRITSTTAAHAGQTFASLNRVLGTGFAVQEMGKRQAKFNWFMKAMLTLPQIERENAGIPGVEGFVTGARNWWGTKAKWTAKWDEWVDRVRSSGYGKADLTRLWRFANEVTVLSDELGRNLLPDELAQEARRVGGLDDGLMALWQDGRMMLAEALEQLRLLSIARIHALWNPRIAQETDIATRIQLEKSRDEAIEKNNDEFQMLANRDYWPLARFGTFTVNVVANRDLTFMGKEFKEGQTVLFELFETGGEQQQRKLELLRAHKDAFRIAAGKVDESLYSFMGLPPSVLRMMEKELIEATQEFMVGDEKVDADTRKMLAKQLDALRTVILHFTPENAFKQRLLRRKGTRGFTDDGLRAMASTGQSFAGHIARATHRGEMDTALDDLDAYRREMEFSTDPAFALEGNKLTDLLNYFKRAEQDMLNPGGDLANLRAAGFLWYLGAVPRAAIVQLGQPIFTTYPWLASRYGDGGAVAEMAKGYKLIRQMLARKGDGIAPHLSDAIRLGIDAGFLNQSLFTELAGLAEGSNLQRLMPGKFLKSQEAAGMIRKAGYYASYMFQKGEEINRLVTFRAAYMLELKKLLGMEGATDAQVKERMTALSGTAEGNDAKGLAFKAGRSAVEQTQGEYARWARPELMRGKKSAIFLFKMYTQTMGYFALRDPGKWRFLAIQLAIAGALGLPFAEDLLDILNAATQGELCDKGDPRLCAREYLQELGLNPELAMHGLARLATPWDWSPSLSLGRMVPGVDPVTSMMMPGGSLKDSALRLQSEMLGALFSIPLNWAKAVSTGSERDVEAAMPTVVRDIYRTYRRARDGGERSRSGAMTAEIDWSDPMNVLTHLGQAAGLRPAEIARESEMRWAQMEAAKYWSARHDVVTRQYYHLYKTGQQADREALADVMKAVEDYNNAVPYPEMKISRAQLRKGLKLSLGRMKKEEAGIAPEKKYRRLYSEIAEGFGGGD